MKYSPDDVVLMSGALTILSFPDLHVKMNFYILEVSHVHTCLRPGKLASIVCPTLAFGAWSLLLASFAGSQIYMTKLASKQRTGNIFSC